MAGPTMTLLPFIFPHLRPGSYTVDTSQAMTGGGLQSSDTLPGRTHHLEVTAPRFSMPGTEVFGVFPPPNATGPFAGRLAQIVLRSRTLPWERSTSSSQPWLALVVLADGEANFQPDVAATSAYTSGRAPAGIPGDARCAALEVPLKVITDTFPAAGELDLMAHVRQVEVTETEYADSDGYVSVLVSNRLPQPSTSYAAYLISLENQTDLLPAPGAVADEVPKKGAWDDLFDIGDVLSDLPRVDKRFPVLGPAPTGPTRSFVEHDVRAGTAYAGRGRADAAAGPTAGGATSAGASKTVKFVSGANLVSHNIDFGHLGEVVGGINATILTTFTFPVLAHWEFSCSAEDGDFAGYLNHLDVGLLGTAPVVDPRAPVVPVTASGHVAIAHTDRRGESGTAWYRGPFTPSKITRDPAGKPYHVADQARRIGTDGREDLSYAAAFEVGRLLAMSDLQFLRALRQWVRQEFVSRRRQDVVQPYHGDLGITLPYDAFFGRELSIELLIPHGFGGDPLPELGDPLPLHDAELFFAANDPQVIARGFGLDAQLVADAFGTSLMNETVDVGVLDLGINRFEDLQLNTATLAGLTNELGDFVDLLDDQAFQIERDHEQGTGGPIITRLTEGLP